MEFLLHKDKEEKGKSPHTKARVWLPFPATVPSISQLEKMSSLFSRIQSIEELKQKYLKVLNSALLDLTIKGEL